MYMFFRMTEDSSGALYSHVPPNITHTQKHTHTHFTIEWCSHGTLETHGAFHYKFRNDVHRLQKSNTYCKVKSLEIYLPGCVLQNRF